MDKLVFSYQPDTGRKPKRFCLQWHVDIFIYNSHLVRKPKIWFQTWSDTSRAVESQRMEKRVELWDLESKGFAQAI